MTYFPSKIRKRTEHIAKVAVTDPERAASLERQLLYEIIAFLATCHDGSVRLEVFDASSLLASLPFSRY